MNPAHNVIQMPLSQRNFEVDGERFVELIEAGNELEIWVDVGSLRTRLFRHPELGRLILTDTACGHYFVFRLNDMCDPLALA